jgi:ethanolamine ammonia-lyase small subunit
MPEEPEPPEEPLTEESSNPVRPEESLTLSGQEPGVIENPWQSLRKFTPARIALGRAGHSLPTRELLNFQLAHAQARDAVYSHFDPALVAGQLAGRGYSSLQVHSQAPDRITFLKRPDFGRRLSPVSREYLLGYVAQNNPPPNLLFVLGDGLSAEAIHRHAVPVLDLTARTLQAEGWRIGPVIIASQARVALGDEIGQLLGAGQVAILIGERPGLSAPDSLGIYLTYRPCVGRLESERNCISNIRPAGLSYEAASSMLADLFKRAEYFQYSGVKLKEP